MKRWRIGAISFCLVMLLCGVLFRLYQIQVMSTRTFTAKDMDLIQLAADAQSKEIVVHSGRGKIMDRHGQILAGKSGWRLLVFPQSKHQLSWRKQQFQQLAKILGIPFQTFSIQLQNSKYPTILSYPDRTELLLSDQQKSKIATLNIPGVFVIYSDGRMLEQQIGQQVIGRLIRQPFIIREQYAKQLAAGKYTLQSRVGISGLEATFETFLHGAKETVFSYYHTRNGKPLHGAKVQMIEKKEPSSFQPYQVVTTLDKELQQQTEYILQKQKVMDGAIVVQDIKTGDMLALASTPLGHTVEDDQNPWDHRGLMEATPGSIFKLVVAIAGLETGGVSPQSRYYCKGNWDRYHLTDANGSGHGSENFSQAFADSCNLYFAQLSKQLGGKKIQAYAKQLGLGQRILWSDQKQKQMPTEHTGMIYATEKHQQDEGAVVQTGIGQRDVKITPVQAANMVTSLFHQGKAWQPRLVTEVRSPNGQVIKHFPQKYLPTSRKLKTSTVQAVQKMMRETVTQGTAASLKTTKWPVAGKTGTAQIGIHGDRYNKWMIGFGPVDQPRYVVSVVVRSVKNADDSRAKQIFGQVMDTLYELEQKRKQR